MSRNRFEITFATKLFRENSKRNTLIIVTLAFSVIFSTVLIYFFQLLLSSQHIFNLQRFGTKAEAVYYGADYEDYLKLRESEIFEDISYGAVVQDSVYVEGQYIPLQICYYEEKAAQWSNPGLTYGSWPITVDEIVVNTAFCENVGNVNVGEEVYIDLLQESFTVCGICPGETSSVYLSKGKWESFGLEESANGTIYVRLSSIEGAEELLRGAGSRICGKELVCGVNHAYLQSMEESMFYMQLTFFSVFAILTFLFVYSAYYFAMVKDLKLYSALRLLGTRKKQVQTIVRYQALMQFMIGVPIGLLLGVLINRIVLWWMNAQVPNTQLVEQPQAVNYLLATYVMALAVLIGINGPVRMMSRMSGIQAYRYAGVKRIKNVQRKAHKVSMGYMAFRNIQRNVNRAALIGICVALVLIVFVLNMNLLASISCYDDYIYETQNDFVIGNKYLIFQLSRYQGIEQYPETAITDRLRWGFPFEGGHYAEMPDEEKVEEIKKQCVSEQKIFYFFNYAAIQSSDYLNKVRDAIDRDIYCTQQEDYYQALLDYFKFVPQQQYYVDFSELEKCNVIEGKLDRDLFESGQYAVVFYDESLQSEPLYHVGEKMPVGAYNFDMLIVQDKVLKAEGEHGQNTQRQNAKTQKSRTKNAESEVEVMAVVSNPPQMYAVAGMNACFLPDTFTDVWTDENITLYGITMDSDDEEKTEAVLKSVIGTDEADTGNMVYLSDAAREEQKRQDTFIYKAVYGGIAGILCAAAFMNLINSIMLGLIERRKELSTLHALGMTKKQLISMLRIENMMITGMGALPGYVVGMLLSRRFALGMYGDYLEFECYVSYTWWPGILLIGCILLLSCVYPNRRTKLQDNKE